MRNPKQKHEPEFAVLTTIATIITKDAFCSITKLFSGLFSYNSRLTKPNYNIGEFRLFTIPENIPLADDITKFKFTFLIRTIKPTIIYSAPEVHSLTRHFWPLFQPLRVYNTHNLIRFIFHNLP